MNFRYAKSLLLVTCLILSACSVSSGSSARANSGRGDLTVFAASSLTQAFSKLGVLFEEQYGGSKVRFNFSASDVLAAQITQGAPADVFAAAGSAPMKTVTAAHLTKGRPRVFASNKLVVISPRGNSRRLSHPQDLAEPGVKLVLAAPGVPAGDYARQMLQNLGILKEAEKNVVSNEVDDKSVVSKVMLGDADAGIVYVTDLTPDVSARLNSITIPAADNVVARFPIATLDTGPVKARQFVQLVLSPKGRSILQDFGFGPP
jgi:molybdate transport system substrate-binding protein